MEGPLYVLLISSRSVNKLGHHSQFLFLIGRFLKTSPLKPLGLMNRNLIGSIHGRFSIKIAYFVPICLQTWLAQAILVSGWLISKKSSPLKPLDQMNQNVVRSTYGRSRSVNKHDQHRQFLFLVGRFLKKSFPLKPSSQMNRNCQEAPIESKDLCKVSANQNESRVTQARPTEPLVSLC